MSVNDNNNTIVNISLAKRTNSSKIYYSDESINVTLFNRNDTANQKPIFFIFDDLDLKSKSTNPLDIQFMFGGETELIYCSPLRDDNNNDFDCLCAPIKNDSNDFNLLCNQGFSDIQFSHGTNFSGDFVRTFIASVSDGTSVVTDIDYRIQKDFSARISDGTNLSTSVQAIKQLVPKMSYGDRLYGVLDYRISAKFAVSASYGSSLSTSIQYNYLLNVNAQYGDTLKTTLDYRPQQDFNVQISVGESIASVALQASKLLSPKFSAGESASFELTPRYAVYLNDTLVYDGSSLLIDLKTIPSTNIVAFMHSGESVEANTTNLMSLDNNMHHGENLLTSLKTLTTLSINNYDGSRVYTNLKYVPPININSSIRYGEYARVNISTTAIINVSSRYGSTLATNLKYFISTGSEFYAYDGSVFNAEFTTYAFIKSNMFVGETLTSEIEPRKPIAMSVNFYDGTSLKNQSFNIHASFAVNNRVGENVKVTQIDNLENMYVSVGENLHAELSSEILIDSVDAQYGDALSGQLKTGPSFPLGTFKFAHGTSLHHILTTQISTYFKVDFSFNTEFVQTIWDTTYIDLNRTDCCPIKREDLLHVNLQRDKEVEVRYDIPREIAVNVDMRTNPIFYPKIHHGTSVQIIDYDMLLTANFRYGENVDVLDLYNDLIVDLNSGNPEYDEDMVIIETNKEYTEFKNNFSNIGDGTQLDVDIAMSYGLHANAYYGQYAYSDFFVESAWRLNFIGFFGLRWTLSTNVHLGLVKVVSGNQLDVTFYEEPMIFSIGENVSCNITTEYDVAFVDDGCLDNAHIPTTSEGIPIIDSMNEMAIEGRYYSRFIRGRCF